MSLPKKGTPEWDLYIAAIEVAMYPPVKMQAHTTQVGQKEIKALRDAINAVGIDWQAAKKNQTSETDARRKRAYGDK